MKFLISALLSVVISSVATAGLPTWDAVKKSERGSKIFKIGVALVEYDQNYGEYPPTLLKLIEEDFLKPEDLLLKNTDGSLSVPDYFQGRSIAGPPDAVLLRASSKDKSFTIVLKVDLSVRAIENETANAEQGGGGSTPTSGRVESEPSDAVDPD